MMSKHGSSRRPRFGGLRRGVIATALAALSLAPALAGAIVVPDHAPTIQAGIDSGADTVQVRPGFYPETILVDRPLVLLGLRPTGSNEIPETMGLILENTRQQSAEGVTIADFHFRGPVQNAFSDPSPRGPFTLIFSDCVMDSGVSDRTQLAWDQIGWDIMRCRITGGVDLSTPESVYLLNNTIHGPVLLSASANGLYVSGNSIEGPGSFGISGIFADQVANILGNTVRGFDVGVRLAGRYDTHVENNLVEECSQTGIVLEDGGSDYRHWLTGNTVRSCGSAFNLYGGESIVLGGNVAEDCVAGIFAAAGQSQVVGNRVSRCGSGITIVPVVSYFQGLESRSNRVERCGGGLDLLSLAQCISDRDTVIDCAAGIRLEAPVLSAAIDSAFVLSCGGPGITIDGSSASATRCVVGRSLSDGILLSSAGALTLAGNTSFLNGGSGFAVHATGSASGAVTANVGFGNTRSGLTADPGIALGLSCNDWFGNPAGATAGLSPGPTDLALDPVFCDLSANDVHLAPSAPLVNAPGCGLIGALGAGCPEGATTGVIEAAVAPPTGFTLARLGPVPTTGRIALELTLPRAAAIDVAVLDVQGRAIARLAGGEWSAGRHAVEWNGEGAQGRVPPGLYLVRYRFPGGADSRRIVIAR